MMKSQKRIMRRLKMHLPKPLTGPKTGFRHDLLWCLKRRRWIGFVTLAVITTVVFVHSPPQSLESLTVISDGSQYSAIQSFDLSDPRAPFVAWPLARLCNETAFVPGLTFLCDNNSGGVGNIRNYILTCLRYAIEAGATNLVMPTIRTRSSADLADLWKASEDLSYMFSKPHFVAALSAACPQVGIFDDLSQVPGVAEKEACEGLPAERMVEQVVPKSFGQRGGCDWRDPNRETDRFGDKFRYWLNSSSLERGLLPVSSENPRLIRISWGVIWDWTTWRDGSELAATFGGLLRFRDDVLYLGDVTVAAIRKLAVARGSRPGSHGRFLGVHLRTEEDALSSWPSYEDQSRGYLNEAKARGFRGQMTYLASGSRSEAKRFAKEAWEVEQLRVVTKHDLLRGRDLKVLKSLSWDQQALVDFVVLLHADYFVGVSPSSFSVNIALKRHLRDEGLFTRPWKCGHGDGRSWLVGRYENYWDDWIFMFDGMWP